MNLAQEQKQVKFSEMLEAFLEKMGFKDASKYFTSLQQQNGQIDPATGQPIAGGAPAAPGIPQGQGMGATGAVPNIQAPPGGSNQPLMG